MKEIVKSLGHIGIPCKNLSTSIAFYQDLGFEIEAQKDGLNGYDVAMMRMGNCVLELYQDVQYASAGRENGFIDHIALVCDDVAEAYQKCRDGGKEIITGIEDTWIYAPTLCRYFYILGPDSERIEIMQYLAKD